MVGYNKHWAERFYPKGLDSKEKLTYLAERFNTVEVNSTFYRTPTEAMVQGWYQRVPADFVFAVKLNMQISRYKHLQMDEEALQTMDQWFQAVHHLREKLGVVLVQLPPSMKIDLKRVETLAKTVKKLEKHHKMKFPLAIEFRNASWFEDETFGLLKKLNIASVVIDSPGRWPANKTITADFAYIRFHGNKKLYASKYTHHELDDWATFIQNNCGHCKQVYAYFNNDHSAFAVDNARYLASTFT